MTIDNDFLAERRQSLVELQRQLTEELTYLQESARPVALDQTQFGRVSRIDAIGQQEMQKAAAQQTERRLRRVIQALRKIEEDDYGWCDHCGEVIERPRLKVQPEARYCLACQDAAEQA